MVLTRSWWEIVGLVTIFLVFVFLLMVNASSFDDGEVNTILELAGLVAVFEVSKKIITSSDRLKKNSILRDPASPMWNTLRFGIIFIGAVFFLAINVSSFDVTEIRTLGTLAIVALGFEVLKKLITEMSERLKSQDLHVNLSGKAEGPPGKIIQNQSERRIAIKSKTKQGNLLVLPPFGQRIIERSELELFNLKPWEQLNIITIEDELLKERSLLPAVFSIIAFFISAWFFMMVFGNLLPGDRALTTHEIIGGGIVTALGIFLISQLVSVISVVGPWAKDIIYLLIHKLRQSLSLIMVLLIAVALPAVLAFYQEVYFSENIAASSSSVSFDRTVGRLMQVCFIAIVSSLPALLYFRFSRKQMCLQRETFIQDITVLDSNLETVEDARMKYQTRLDEIYGPEQDSGGKYRYIKDVRWPILLATLVITLGWVLTLNPFGYKPFLGAETFLTPHPMPINFGFLGAYFFVISMILRRYARGDLKPKAYNHMTVRFLVVTVIVWAVTELPTFSKTDEISSLQNHQPLASSGVVVQGEQSSDVSEDYPVDLSILLVFAFVIGIVPETGLAFIREVLNKSLGKLIPSFDTQFPLSDLEGISLYDRARLLEEGVENIEHLVHHDLISLMLETRIPLQRLVDWMDQGILYLHMVDIQDANSPRKNGKQTRDHLTSLRKLRKYGVRTASDLLRVHAAARKRGEQEENRLDQILDPPGSNDKRLRSVIDALEDDEWVHYIQNWRKVPLYKNLNHLEDFLRPEIKPEEVA